MTTAKTKAPRTKAAPARKATARSTKSKRKSVPRPKAPKKTGRPPVEIPEETVRILAKVGCTTTEIAAELKVDRRTLQRRFAATIKEAKEAGRTSLRRAQWRVALKGNPTMLIWLGKNELGQKDRAELTGPDDGPLIPERILVEYVDPA